MPFGDKLFVLELCLTMMLCFEVSAQKPCAARRIPGQSVVCVCNATYCDTVTRAPPPPARYVTYTSSQNGSRFKMSGGILEPCITTCTKCMPTLELDSSVMYQEVSGFGGAVTDSAGINYKSLNRGARKNLVNSFFGLGGIEYSMVRIPIGGTDFSTRPYAYNDLPADDKHLRNFSLSFEDFHYKIPFIKAAMKVATVELRPVGSMWSPPIWMKDSNSYTSGHLKKEYYQTLADYFCKFLEHYEKNNIYFWAVTTTNEPLNIVMASPPINRMSWNAYDLCRWLEHHLGPTMRSKYSDVLIITGDDQRYTIPLWFNTVISECPGSENYIDGFGVHFYFDDVTPAKQLTYPFRDYPDKFVLYTEASIGSGEADDQRVILGSWKRAEAYALNIMEDLNHNVIGWIDWNLCLDESGGPTWVDNHVDSSILVSAERQEFYKQPMFYAIGHFSKFIPRGSRRVQAELVGCPSLPNVAFLTPQDTIVIVVVNEGKEKKVLIKHGESCATVHLEAESFVTIELSNHGAPRCSKC